MENREKILNWLNGKYGKGGEIEVNGINGLMWGNDECFDDNRFYQYFLSEDTLYKAYYEVDNDTELDAINYSQSAELQAEDVEFLVDFVI